MSDRGRGRGGFRGRGDSPSPGRGGGFRGGAQGPPPFARGRGDFPGGRGGGGGYGRGGPSRGRGGPPPKAIFNENVPAQVDPRVGDADMNALVQSFKKLNVSDATRIVRPDFGKRGRAITLRANYFAIKYPKNLVVYDYPVLIEPSVKEEERRTRRRLFEILEKQPAVARYKDEIAHDSSQRLISKRPLPAGFRAEIKFYEAHQSEPRPNAKEYTITLGEARVLRSSDLDAYLQGDNAEYDPSLLISAFNHIIAAEAVRKGVRFGRNRYFWDPKDYGEEPMPLSSGLEIWKGFYSSVRPTYRSLLVNINVAMSPFFTPYMKLSDALRQYSNATRGARHPESFYRRVRVTTKHLGYKKKSTIVNFSDSTPRQMRFKCDEYGGGEISVEDYFRRKYNITLSDPDLPLVNLGNKTKDVWVPAELCELEPGQPHAGALAERETAEMIKYACKAPYENARLITQQGLQKLGLTYQASPMKGFGVEVSSDMTVVQGRVLMAPKVHYQGKTQNSNNGSWNIMGVKFSRGAEVSNLAFLVAADGDRSDFMGRDDPALNAFIEGFMGKCRSSGMAVRGGAGRAYVNIANMRGQGREAALKAIEREIEGLGRPNMLLVMLSNRDQNIFSGIKKMLDCKLGIPNVCMLMAKARNDRGQDQYYSNIALKVNAKLGGINHQIDPSATSWLKDTMLVGMDVTHPGLNCVKGTPSISAVVASCDGTFIQYPASLRLQEHRVEMIERVEEMMVERLQEYQRRNKVLPNHIIVFRDGVSESQFEDVKVNERPKIQKAFTHFGKYNPKLTIAICGKRHHTRFYATRMDEADDRTSNTKAGTVVDRGVTSVYDFDFYLQAHSALQGTVRPTHYTIIYDDNKFQSDVIQQGTHDLSYLWARATKSVSYAPPAYWADRACDRARLYLQDILPPGPRDRVRKLSEKDMRKHAEGLWGNGVHANLRGSMFYL